MSFILYFVLLVVVAASTVFGIDFVTPPSRHMPDVPIGRTHSAHHTPKTPAAKQADAQAFTPVYPAAPGGAKAKSATNGVGTDASAASSNPESAQAAVAQPEPVQAKAVSQQTTTAQNAPGKCNVQACASAYRSFRASDCSYQPYDGPRRFCSKTGGTLAQRHAKPREQTPRSAPMTEARWSQRGADIPPEIARIVRQLTPDAQDVRVQDADGRIVTLHPGRARDQASCNVAACSAAYQSFNAADCSYQPFNGPRRFCTK